jgi:predicted Zn finger-like uncharacterized protein
MKRSATFPSIESADAAASPATCPFCRSSSIVTKAKNPDADSYWRCTTCGEIWNGGRSGSGSQARRPWQ